MEQAGTPGSNVEGGDSGKQGTRLEKQGRYSEKRNEMSQKNRVGRSDKQGGGLNKIGYCTDTGKNNMGGLEKWGEGSKKDGPL